MKHKILSILEKVPSITTLPDGYYDGLWSGHCIDINYKGKAYELMTDEGIRGINVKVIVEVKNGMASFDEKNS